MIEVKEYATTDGKRFTSAEDAEKHETLTQAENAFNDAAAAFEKALFHYYKTADGKPFSFLDDYYYIVDEWFSPHIERISFYPRDVRIEIDDHRSPIIRNNRAWNNEEKPRSYSIKHLYASEKEANKKLLQLKQNKIVQMQNEVFELEKKIEGLRW